MHFERCSEHYDFVRRRLMNVLIPMLSRRWMYVKQKRIIKSEFNEEKQVLSAEHHEHLQQLLRHNAAKIKSANSIDY